MTTGHWTLQVGHLGATLEQFPGVLLQHLGIVHPELNAPDQGHPGPVHIREGLLLLGDVAHGLGGHCRRRATRHLHDHFRVEAQAQQEGGRSCHQAGQCEG